MTSSQVRLGTFAVGWQLQLSLTIGDIDWIGSCSCLVEWIWIMCGIYNAGLKKMRWSPFAYSFRNLRSSLIFLYIYIDVFHDILRNI